MKCRNFLVLALILFTATSLYAKPRISLAHFEKDLQSMSKKTKNVTIKAGSFVDCLADKRRKKEVIDQEIVVLQKEVDALAQEVAQHEAAERELLIGLAEQKNRVQQRVQDVHSLVAELAQAHDTLNSTVSWDA